jgi:2-polyprenyl-3-methyl-5-hydroxy-6-metoxy-1,4-benzoquinol methylase
MMDIDRGSLGRTPRIRSLDVESQQDFVRGFREWMAKDMDQEVNIRADVLAREHQVNLDGEPKVEELRAIFDPDPLIATRLRVWITNQRQMWAGLLNQMNAHKSHYLDELERSDAAGPGTLLLNPDLDIPDYCRHEIHIQPGGYIGNELAGPLYHYGTNSFYMGQNDSDEFHIALAKRASRPADGEVKRIVDLGCGIGQLTIAMKEEFPEAEVWGVDVAGPVLRYAHKRGVDLNIDVNFVQALAEDTKFESGTLDIVAAYILFHEVPAAAAKDICAEAFRMLRPGGVFDVCDFPTGPLRNRASTFMKYRSWADHHYNGERWSQEFTASDFLDTLRSVGFVAELKTTKHPWMLPNYVAFKPE